MGFRLKKRMFKLEVCSSEIVKKGNFKRIIYLFFRVLIWSELKRRFGKIERRFILLKQRFTPPETAFCQAWNKASERQKITFLTMEAKKNGLQG